MYYVNKEQIAARLAFIPVLTQALAELYASRENGNGSELILDLARERVLHLAIEMVTDVGSLLIDGFLMRDASSYEDIIEIIAGEEVIGLAEEQRLLELVRLRRELVQEYNRLDRERLQALSQNLAPVLEQFALQVEGYLQRELEGQ